MYCWVNAKLNACNISIGALSRAVTLMTGVLDLDSAARRRTGRKLPGLDKNLEAPILISVTEVVLNIFNGYK